MSIIEKAMNKNSGKKKKTAVKKKKVGVLKKRNLTRNVAPTTLPEIDPEQLDLTEIDYDEAPPKARSKRRDSTPKKKPSDFVAVNKLLQEKGVLPSDELLTQNADEFRIIKRPILANAFGAQSQLYDNPNLLMVTSSLPNEGKTNIAVNIALSIAHELNNTVLLIDADIAKADTSLIFDVEDKPGLIDLLVDENLDVDKVLVETGVPGFQVLPAGSDYTVKNELLASRQMRDLLEELTSRYPDRMIVIDSPPLLVTAESRIVSTLVGQIALVIESAGTSKHQVADAAAMLERDKPINLILNKTSRNFGLAQYGTYGYGYGYGSRSRQNNESN